MLSLRVKTSVSPLFIRSSLKKNGACNFSLLFSDYSLNSKYRNTYGTKKNGFSSCSSSNFFISHNKVTKAKTKLLTSENKILEFHKHGVHTNSSSSPIHETPKYMDFETLVDMHLVTRQSFGDRPLFGEKKDGFYQYITYKEFGKKVDDCRSALNLLGIKRGDTIACISKNRVEWAVCAYATYSLGATFVPMYEEQLMKDWRYIIENSDSKVLFVSTEEIYSKTFHLAHVIGNLHSVYCFDAPDYKNHSFQKLLVDGIDYSTPAILPHQNDIATLIYTSGTTGTPKGVRLSHKNLISNITGVRDVLPKDFVSCYDRSLSFLPWAHCYGQTLELHALMAHGACLGLSEGIDKILGNLEEIKPTILFTVPTLFKKVYDAIHAKMLNERPAAQFLFKRALQAAHHIRMNEQLNKPSSLFIKMEHMILSKLIFSKIHERFGGKLKVSFVGGAATSLEVLSFFENIGIIICEGYGLTETSPLITLNTTQKEHRWLGTTGRPIGGVTVKICNDGKEVELNEEGEICVNGPSVMEGYHKDPAATADVFFEINGKKYFRTGDIGKMENGTHLRITGRMKEQYKLENGKYVVPGPIEAALTSSKYISQAILYGQDKPYNVALIVPDWELLKKWAIEKGGMSEVQCEVKANISTNVAVSNMIEGEIQNTLEKAKRYEIPRRWELLEDAFTAERGMLTPKMSIKRHIVVKEYKDLIHHMYGDLDEIYPREELRVG